MSENFNYCHVAELTDKGCKRSSNEDWLIHFVSPNGLVAVVCDGMGGHVGGQIASHTAIDAIHQFMMQERGGSPSEHIVEAMNVANAAIISRASQQPELTGMGSTCVMLIVRNGKVYIGSVGDSRVYLIRNHRIKQLTVDQSYVQMLVDAGSITPEEAEHHHRKNEITNALGLKGMQPATVLPKAIDPEAGDCFLLCSDGLSGMVPDREIEKVVSRQSDKTQQERVEELVLRAKRNGGVDNITCQIVEFSVSPNGSKKAIWWKRNIKSLAAACFAVLALAIMCYWLIPKHKPQDKDKEHSEIVKGLINTVDSVITVDCGILHSTKNEFLELTENKDFGGVKILLKRPASNDTTIIIRHPLSIKNIEVTPKDYVKTTFVNEDSTKCVLSITKPIPNDEREISLTLRGKPSYLLLIPLKELDKGPEKTNIASDNPTEKKDGVVETDYTASKISEETKKSKPKDSQTDCTIKVNKSNYVILINGENDAPADFRLFYSEYALTETYMDVTDKGWYTIINNGNTCKITIKRVPSSPNNIIELPTRPACNDDKGIILRVK